MKKKSVHLLILLIMLMTTSFLNAASIKILSGDQVEALIESGEEVEIPVGETYKIILPDGDTAYLEEKTIFKLARVEDIIRFLVRKGSIRLQRSSGEGGRVEFELAGLLIESEGSELIATVGEQGVSYTQTSDIGTIFVRETGNPELPGSEVTEVEQITTDDGSGKTGPASQPKIENSAGSGPIHTIVPLPEKIVIEDISDISPS